MRLIRKVSDDFWWSVARACSYATFFHTPIWREMARRADPRRFHDATFGAVLPSGVRVVFPLVRTRHLGPLRWLHSTFEGCYGGFIADGPVSPAEAAQIYRHVCRWSTYSLHILENPLGESLPEELQGHFSLVVNEVAHTVRLDADFETVFSRFQKTQRKDYRRGLKRGVQVRATSAIEDYRAYYDVYRDAVGRWGHDERYGYSWHIFEQLHSLSQVYPEQIKLWVMTVEGRVVGGTVMFYWGTHASAWNGTAHRDFLDYEVMPVGDTEMIRDAIERGYSYFDFNTSALNEGVSAYKQRFGAEAMPVRLWRYKLRAPRPMRSLFDGLRRAREQLAVVPQLVGGLAGADVMLSGLAAML